MTRSRIHHIIYLFGLIVLVAALPVFHFIMGLGFLMILLNWLAEWNWKEKWQLLKENKEGLIFSGIYVFFVLGLFLADDCLRASSFLLDKLPMLLVPAIIITSQPVTKRELKWVFDFFIASTTFFAILSLCYWATHEVSDVREITIGIDHIRFSLCVVFSIVLCANSIVQKQYKRAWLAWLYALVILFLTGYLFVVQTLTGIVVLAALIVFYILYLFVKMPHSRMRTALMSLSIACLLGGALYVTVISLQYFIDKDKTIDSRQTALGNPYVFDSSSLIENGHRIGYYVCPDELRSAWAMRSDTAYSDIVEQTLIRYLNSKGLHKDYAAVMSLTEQDVRNVEKHVANYAYADVIGLRRALYQTFFSLSLYQKFHTIDDSSLMQRIELWSASCKVIGENWFLGVGMGDHKVALDEQLAKQNSPIADRHNRGSHSQYLTFWLMGGILLLLYFFFVIIYPFVRMRPRITLVYTALILIIVLSCLAEDTLETQTGRLMYATLLPLLLFSEQ